MCTTGLAASLEVGIREWLTSLRVVTANEAFGLVRDVMGTLVIGCED